MNNNLIAEKFSLLSQLMDIHGENSFRAKSYAAAAFAIKKLPIPLSELSDEKISALNGIGTSSAQKIREIINTGKLSQLEKLISNTAPGVIEMLNLKGIGPKKIHIIWKEMGIESIGELLYACTENRLKLFKGFGEKTQQNVIDTIQFYFKNKEWHLYVQVEQAEPLISEFLQKIFPKAKISLSGAFVRQMEIIKELEYIITETEESIRTIMNNTDGFSETDFSTGWISYQSDAGISVKLTSADKNDFEKRKIETSCSTEFLQQLKMEPGYLHADFGAESSFFSSIGIPVIPPALREMPETIESVKRKGLPRLIVQDDIRGIIHSHSNWSDGTYTIEDMANAARNKGLEYLVISDHSKTAFYANGLSANRVKEQHQYIDELNSKLAPFKIFKSIESDILNDGSLDYDDEILAGFDLVIASVHSNLKMTEEKATQRLITAIKNPYTTILGHMTGRLLLWRAGYPVNIDQIIDASLQNNVTIELNAHPNRLDIDWRHIQKVLNKGVKISINPDAHHIDGFNDTKYGVLVAQKAGVTREDNLSSLSLPDFEKFLAQRKARKII